MSEWQNKGGNGGGQRNFPSVPKNALDHPNLKVYGERQDGSKSNPVLQARVINNNPRLYVYTNIEGDSDRPIQANVDMYNFAAMMIGFKRVLSSKEPIKFDFTVQHHPFFNGERSKDLKDQATLTLARGQDGVIFMALRAYKRPTVKFIFKKDRYLVVRKSDGTEFNDVEYSELMAEAFYTTMDKMVPTVASTNYIEKKPAQSSTGNQGNGGGNRGQWNNNKSDGGGKSDWKSSKGGDGWGSDDVAFS